MAELALFFSAFIAATILPFSSEVAFVAALKSGISLSHAMFVASSGNILAIIFNYYLGYFLYEKTKRKLFGSKIGRHIFLWGDRYGYITLFASWLPIVGDPFTVVAGLFRLKFIWFVIIAGSLRVGRYYLLAIFLR